VISTLRYFREEYQAHIREKRCPAGVCRELIAYVIDGEKCTGCGACLRACPYGAITGVKKEPHVIDLPACKKCGICSDGCKFEAITISSGGVPCYSM
jgi:NADH-quinone oxidoreductase subunit F